MLQDIWTPDVKANQLADVISGVSPIRSMVNVGSGVADLILLPIEQYRKDGRLARGVQRGTNSFVRSTAMEMMKLGARLATGTQVILERAEGVLGGGSKFADGLVAEVEPSLMERNEMDSGLYGEEGSEDEGLGELVSRYANQPSGAVEGVQEAYRSLSKNINSAAQTILAVPMEVYERSGGDVSDKDLQTPFFAPLPQV
jgi:autophagy-related protein 2